MYICVPIPCFIISFCNQNGKEVDGISRSADAWRSWNGMPAALTQLILFAPLMSLKIR